MPGRSLPTRSHKKQLALQRQARLAAALRSNLRKRKAQGRPRELHDPAGEAQQGEPAPDAANGTAEEKA
jgi:hypothetical protein